MALPVESTRCRITVLEAAMSNDNDLSLNVTWDMRDVTITAVGHRGAVFNERSLQLRFCEGRHHELHPNDDYPEDETLCDLLSYEMRFWIKDGKDPDNARQSECKVGIIGTMSDGRQWKIHGDGYVGRDNHGQIEGSFFTPPRMELSEAEEDLIEIDRPT